MAVGRGTRKHEISFVNNATQNFTSSYKHFHPVGSVFNHSLRVLILKVSGFTIRKHFTQQDYDFLVILSRLLGLSDKYQPSSLSHSHDYDVCVRRKSIAVKVSLFVS